MMTTICYYFSSICLFSLWILCATTTNNEAMPTDEVEDLSKPKHYKEGKHNVEYDHEAFLGDEAKTFDSLPPEESRKRLGIIADKIDHDKDGFITQSELKDWIKYTQEKFVRDNVDRTWKTHNPNLNEKMTWNEYSELVYGFMKDMPQAELIKKDNGLSYKGLYDRDQRRWSVADQNADGSLTKFEFYSFLHPEESPIMRDLVVLETIEDMDKDKDGKISLEEYIGDMYQGEEDSEKPQWIENEIENFKIHRDKDGDGFLVGDEVKNFVLPDDYDHANAEAQHLIYEADADGDKQLTKEEILEKYDLFVGSQATDFGEALLRHDEF